MKKVYDIIGVIGIVMIFTAAGMSDSGTLNFVQTVVMALFSVALLFVSFYGVNFESVEINAEGENEFPDNSSADCLQSAYANQ